MKLQFDPNQAFQLDAVAAATTANAARVFGLQVAAPVEPR